MKRSNRLVILVGVLLAVLAFVGIVVLLGQQGRQPSAESKKVNVLVAKSDIAIGDSVTPALVEVKEVDPDAVVGTRLSDPSQLTGAPALFPIGRGSQVSQESVGLGGIGRCISCQLEPGEKAIAFQVERVTGLDFLIQPGDHIDIIFRGGVQVVQETVDSTPDNPRFEAIPGLENAPTVKTLLQNKRVLYVSATKIKPIADPAATPVPGGSTTAKADEIETVVIVFAGTDSDAEVIKFAQTDQTVLGPLTAVLRHADDDVVEDTTGITFKILVERFGIPIPDLINVELPPAP